LCKNGKKQHCKSRAMKVLTEADEVKFDINGKVERRKTQPKIKTEINEDEENEEFLYEMLKKNPS
jgi:hypothetical protein